MGNDKSQENVLLITFKRSLKLWSYVENDQGFMTQNIDIFKYKI